MKNIDEKSGEGWRLVKKDRHYVEKAALMIGLADCARGKRNV